MGIVLETTSLAAYVLRHLQKNPYVVSFHNFTERNFTV
jgi:hypothetical protein